MLKSAGSENMRCGRIMYVPIQLRKHGSEEMMGGDGLSEKNRLRTSASVRLGRVSICH